MVNKKILIIKMQPYNSLNSSNMRMLAMMKGLYDLNYEMDLLTIPLSVVSVENDMSDYEFLKHVHIIEAGENKKYENFVSTSKNNGLKQRALKIMRKTYHKFSLYNHTDSVAKQFKAEGLSTKEYRYIISVSDPKTSHIALLSLLSQGVRAEKIIEYWGDPMLGDITTKTLLPRFIVKREEKKYLSVADRIIYTSPFTLKQQRKAYPSLAPKMDFTPTANVTSKYYEETNNDSFTVGYYGAYNSKVRNLVPLYNAFEELKGIAKLNLVGDSDLMLSPTENVMIRPRGVVKDLEARTDLFVCVLNSSGTQIPGKLYHNAGTNRPILVVVDGEDQKEMLDYLESFNRFEVCLNSVDSIVSAIKRIKTEMKPQKPCKLLEPVVIAKKIIGVEQESENNE